MLRGREVAYLPSGPLLSSSPLQGWAEGSLVSQKCSPASDFHLWESEGQQRITHSDPRVSLVSTWELQVRSYESVDAFLLAHVHTWGNSALPCVTC